MLILFMKIHIGTLLNFKESLELPCSSSPRDFHLDFVKTIRPPFTSIKFIKLN